MKVFTKKEDKMQSLPVNIVVMLIFVIVPSLLYYSFFKKLSNGADIAQLLSGYAMVLFVATIFFIIGLVLLFIFLRGPKKYKATLIEKKRETYEGKEIDYMTFEVIEESADLADDYSQYNCYTYESNNLIEGHEYIVKIWGFTYDLTSVEMEFDDSVELKKHLKKAFKLNILTIILGAFFVGLFVISILGMIFFPEYTTVYVAFAIFSAGAVYYSYKLFN